MPEQPAPDDRRSCTLGLTEPWRRWRHRDWQACARDRTRRARSGAHVTSPAWHGNVQPAAVQCSLALRERRLLLHPDTSEMVSVPSAGTHQIPADAAGTIYPEITNHSHARCGECTRWSCVDCLKQEFPCYVVEGGRALDVTEVASTS